jgi:hypothetical protein
MVAWLMTPSRVGTDAATKPSVHDPHDHEDEEFVLRTDRALTPLAEKLKQHGATVLVTKLASEPDRVTAYVQMPIDSREADECRQILADGTA